jgi:hypothetical protein
MAVLVTATTSRMPAGLLKAGRGAICLGSPPHSDMKTVH